MPPEIAEVRSWLRKARNDWVSCKRIMQPEPAATDTAAFHCQQAVEKTLKAYLVSAGTPFEKTHDLGYLLELCERTDTAFAELRDKAEPLTLFAVGFRYPGSPEPEAEEVSAALGVVEQVWNFVVSRLPSEAIP
jgi:HEPN domain-containing protein